MRLLEDAIATRDRLAHLLGYPTWAAYVLADRMAGTPQRVESFLAQIDSAILTKARQERDEDAALQGGGRRSISGTSTYYENSCASTKYAVDQNEIKQYFPVQHVVDSVLGIYKNCSACGSPARTSPVWQAQVQAYDVTDTATGNGRSGGSTSTCSRGPASSITSRTSRSSRGA